jgi:hypothetical protein
LRGALISPITSAHEIFRNVGAPAQLRGFDRASGTEATRGIIAHFPLAMGKNRADTCARANSKTKADPNSSRGGRAHTDPRAARVRRRNQHAAANFSR